MSFATQLRTLSYITIVFCGAMWLAFLGYLVYQSIYPREVITIRAMWLEDSEARPGDTIHYTIISDKYVNTIPIITRALACENGRKYDIIPNVTGSSKIGENLVTRPTVVVPKDAEGTCRLWWQAAYPPANKYQDGKTYQCLSSNAIEIVREHD
jgi:hypothetical protein